MSFLLAAPQHTDWSSILVTFLVTLTAGAALSLALEPHIRTPRMRRAGSLFVMGSCGICFFWLWTNPLKSNENASSIGQSVALYAYPAVFLLAIASARASKESPAVPESESATTISSIERKRRINVYLSAAAGLTGLATASIGIALAHPPWLWICLAGGWIVAMGSAVMILFAIRPHKVPSDRAIAQPGGRCFKPGDLFVPSDRDRPIMIHRRMDTVRPDDKVHLLAMQVQWKPDLDHLDAFVANFDDDAMVKAKLREFIECGVRPKQKQVKEDARHLGIQIVRIEFISERREPPQLPTRRM